VRKVFVDTAAWIALIEIDLLRGGKPMFIISERPTPDYTQAPVPALKAEDRVWAEILLHEQGLR
jgi:hypothetical protein